MPLMRLIYKTLESERKAIFAHCVNAAVLILIFNLMQEKVYVFYPIVLSAVCLLVYLSIKAFALNSFYKSLEAVIQSGDGEFYGESGKEQEIFRAIQGLHKSHGAVISDMNQKLAGRNSLFTSFIHNMKSSVAVIELACAKDSQEVLADINSENEKLKKNLEQALNVLRLDEFSNDYVPECIELHELLSAVINEKRRDFIYSAVYPRLCEGTALVYTDKKWCTYILEQIISNAIKYSKPEGKVYFDIAVEGKRTVLKISDEGIGISPEDINRVFELFYTGKNGRSDRNATGIGLAMVKHISKQLGHEVSITSAVDKGTCVSISFLSKLY